MEEESLPPLSGADRLAEVVELDGAGNSLDMRRARILAVLKRMDLTPIGYSSFRAFCKVEVGASESQVRQYIRLAESPLALIRAAVIAGTLPPSVAIRGLAMTDAENEAVWLEDALAGSFRAWRQPEPEVEFTADEARDIYAARLLAALNLGQELRPAQADRHIVATYAAREPRQKILQKAQEPPPPPAPLPDWSGPDGAEDLLGPWHPPRDVYEARALLHLATSVRRDRTRLLAVQVEIIRQERLYLEAGYASFESWARHSLSVDVRTLQRYRRALDASPELDLDRALFLDEVATEATREEWRKIVHRVPAAELVRAREAASRGAEDVIRRAYSAAILEVDAMASENTLPRFVSLAALLPPPKPPRALTAHPDLLVAARWYLVQAKPLAWHGIGRIKERDAYTCTNPECARRSLRLHVHHRVYASRGGSDEDEKLQGLCPGCHLRLEHSGHLHIERSGKWLVFTFADRVIWMIGHVGFA